MNDNVLNHIGTIRFLIKYLDIVKNGKEVICFDDVPPSRIDFWHDSGTWDVCYCAICQHPNEIAQFFLRILESNEPALKQYQKEIILILKDDVMRFEESGEIQGF